MNFGEALTASNLSYLFEGFLVTLQVAGLAIVFSFLTGILLAIIRYAKIPVLSQLVAVWVDTIRNLPLLLILFFIYFALPEIGIDMSVVTAAVVGLTIFEGALISEIVRSGLNSIDKGQIEAGRSSGLSYIQTLLSIILPQALRRMVPPTVSQFIALLKDTSLAVVITLPELMHHARILYGGQSNIVIEVLFIVALMYFVVNYTLSLIARRFEAKYV